MTVAFTKFLSLTVPPASLSHKTFRLTLVVAIIVLGLLIARLPLNLIVLLFGGAVFLGLLLRWPLLSVYLLIPIIPFSSLLAIPLGGFRVGLMELVLATGLVAWLLQESTRIPYPQWSSPTPPARPLAPLVWPFLLFLGCVGLSWLNTSSIGASLIETIKWVEMLALYLFITQRLPAKHIKWVVVAILLAGTTQALLGLYQFVFKVGPEGFLLFGGRFLRAYGTFAQPNPYAGYLGLVLPLALMLTLWAALNLFTRQKSSQRSRHMLILILTGAALGVLLAALVASQSRAAWLSFAAAGLVSLIAYSKRPGLIITGLVLAASSLFLTNTVNLSITSTGPTGSVYGVIVQRFIDALDIVNITDISTLEVTDANFATLERLAHWQAAREMWRDNLWLGAGFGNYAVVYPAYAVGRWLDPLGHAHNYLLNLGAETGLVGIMGYLIFWMAAFRVSYRAVRQSRGFYRAIAAGSLGVLVHLHIHNLFDNLYVQGMYLTIAIILALISIIYYAKREKLIHDIND
jgi:O-antigen ligase